MFWGKFLELAVEIKVTTFQNYLGKNSKINGLKQREVWNSVTQRDSKGSYYINVDQMGPSGVRALPLGVADGT